jgi:phosphohistidine phosphatase
MTGFSIFSQSGVIPFRIAGGELRVLMISSRSGRRWIFPKGIIEDGLTPEESAAAEALEEAGVEGEVLCRSLGTYRRKKWGGTVSVELFPMRVTRILDSWTEDGFRQRVWLSVEEAKERISDPALRNSLAGLARLGLCS